MSRGARLLLIIVVGGTLLTVATVGMAAAAIYNSGTIAVDVQENHGGSVSIHVPAGLANLALDLVPDSLIEEALSAVAMDVSTEVAPLLPAVRAAWNEFAAAPDFVLVEVRSDDELVRIEKKGKSLLIRVDSGGGEAVRVSVPIKTIGKLLRKVEGSIETL